MESLYQNRIDFKSIKIQICTSVFDHAVPEHFPKYVAAQLCQCRVDEKVLFFQCFGQRAARSRIFGFHPSIISIFGNNRQPTYRFVFLGMRLCDLSGDRSQQYLPECLTVPEIHPVEGLLPIVKAHFASLFKYFPQGKPGFRIVRTGNKYVRHIVASGFSCQRGIAVRFCRPVVPPKNC